MATFIQKETKVLKGGRGMFNFPHFHVGHDSATSRRYKVNPPSDTKFKVGEEVVTETWCDADGGWVIVYRASEPAHQERWTLAPILIKHRG